MWTPERDLSHPRYGFGLITIKEFSMCDYSLQLVSSRPAQAGKTIIVTGFSGTDTRGFASPLDPKPSSAFVPERKSFSINAHGWTVDCFAAT